MRNLSEMIEQVKAHVRASENLTWAASDYENKLAEAARIMWRQIADGNARVVLRHTSPSVALPADGVIAIPDDCLRIEEVFLIIPNAPAGCEKVNLAYFQPDWMDAHLPFVVVGPCGRIGWTDGDERGKIRVCGVRTGDSVVFVYSQEPVFPFENNGTFRNPDAGETATYPNLPELADSACEHLAAALLLGEEVRDNTPIGYHGQQYSSFMSMIYRDLPVRPVRRYVKHVERW